MQELRFEGLAMEQKAYVEFFMKHIANVLEANGFYSAESDCKAVFESWGFDRALESFDNRLVDIAYDEGIYNIEED